MRYGDRTTFKDSLKIQKRVLGALLMREIITRYGRNNIGFFWLFIEPLLMTSLMVSMWYYLKADQISTLNIIAFIITGYPMMMMWRNASSRMIGAISANTSLLYHRNVKPLDVLFSRLILEVVGATIAQVLLMCFLISIDLINPPKDIAYMLISWILMGMFAFSLGLIISSLAYYFEPLGKVWGTLSILMMPLSGVFFFVNSLPHPVQEYILYLPMVHGTEMFRKGYFGDEVITLDNPYYLFIVNISMLILGLTLVMKYSKGIEPS
ncbi:ABC transporter permease [Pasteurellaceae bacterium TAE3-ERU1]|nr:ABC transporter permease [Pasteurellaceae bacterium TAE3-ERU1]